MKITEYRAYEILCWLDDQAGDHTNLFEQMTFYRDAAALIRQLRDAEQSAWHAGLDAGREQGRGKERAHPSPSVPAGVEGLPRYGFPDGNEPRPVPCADGYWTPWHLAQQPAAEDGMADFEIHAGGEYFASVFGQREQAWKEAMHYVSTISPDDEPEVFEVTRRKVFLATQHQEPAT